jgi:hypothetical protein
MSLLPSLEARKQSVGDAIRSGLAVFPTIYGRKRDPDQVGKVFLGQLQSLAQATDALRIHALLFQSLASLWPEWESFPMPDCKTRALALSISGSNAVGGASGHGTVWFAGYVGHFPCR